MSQSLSRSIHEEIRKQLTWQQRWESEDHGLIHCWEQGRKLAAKSPDIAIQAVNGELPVMAWKGGVEKELKMERKYAPLYYLAKWQGLRREDLQINIDIETEITCSRTNLTVVFTSDLEKYSV